MIRDDPVAIDLFAGAGLFSFAFQQTGFRVAKAIEKDCVAAATYARNVGSHIETGDIAQARPTGQCDVLISGPPCQGYSTLGRRRCDDPRNVLSLHVVRWAKALRPRLVVIENVPAFLDSREWRRVVRALAADNFTVDSFVLDAHDFGCPQHRRRSFIIGWRTRRPFLRPRPRNGVATVRAAWEGLCRTPNGDNQHYSPKPSQIALARMRLIPPGGDKRDVMRKAPDLAAPSWWRLNCEVTDAWGRMEWEKPCNTLRTGLQNASKGRYIHPEQHRVISLREAARLQSIPDRWVFAGLPTQIARQIGNSVPPALGKALARAVRAALA